MVSKRSLYEADKSRYEEARRGLSSDVLRDLGYLPASELIDVTVEEGPVVGPPDAIKNLVEEMANRARVRRGAAVPLRPSELAVADEQSAGSARRRAGR